MTKRSYGNGLWQALSAPLLAFAATFTPATASPSDVFTVGSYPVQAQAADAVTAKKIAIADGERAALKSLLKRLVPVTSYAQLHKVQIAKPDALIDGISVRSERNSTTEYSASLDFTFRADAVRALLDLEHLPYVDTQAPPIIVVPIWQASTQPIPGIQGNAWDAAWASVDGGHALTPIKLETLKPGVHPDTIAALSKGDTTMLRTFAGDYAGEERLVAAILVPEPQDRKLSVTLVGHDAVGTIAWVKRYRFDAADPSYAVELAAVVSLGVLEGRWKASGARVQGARREPGAEDASANTGAGTTAIAPIGGDDLRLSVEYRSIAEWADISHRLSQVPGVDNIDVAGMSGRSARITLRFPGGFERLASLLPQHGLALRQNSGGWVLTGQ